MSRFEDDCLHPKYNRFQQALMIMIAGASSPTITQEYAYSSCEQDL